MLSKDGALAETFLAAARIVVQHTDTRGELDAFESEAVRLTTINRGGRKRWAGRPRRR